MKKSFALIILALVVSLASAQTSQKQTKRTFSMEDLEGLSLVNVDDEPLQGPIAGLDVVSITFEVDKGLSAPKETILAYDDEEIAKKIVDVIQIPQELHRVVKTSFEGERLCYLGEDNFFKCMVQAYADHRPLVLSPDMIWLIISQGFARYVNAHAEDMRDLLVSHEGKMDLIVNSNNNVLTPDGDWERLLNDFSVCVAANTKGELADLMTADFSTTGITERIASQISLMDVVKEYFYFSNIAGICGIPSITLKGRTEDWQKVLDKVRCLKKYNLEKWSDDLEIILEEFVEASKGKYRRWFWQNIVKKLPVDQLTTQRSCLPNAAKTTRLDGWFLKFFPNEEGETRDSVLWNSSMPQEMVRVGFKQILTDTNTDEVVMTIPMELWAGFVGIEEDAKTRALTPKIGWLARIADPETEELARLEEQDRQVGLFFMLCNNCEDKKVPENLSKMKHIRSLSLEFLNTPVNIPSWMDNIQIDKFHVRGKLSSSEEQALIKRFPHVTIRNTKRNLEIIQNTGPLDRQSSSVSPATAKKAKKKNGVKAGQKISGTVSDKAGPLFNVNVVEVDESGRTVGYTTTDIKGRFTHKVVNPQDKIRIVYVGMKSVTLDIRKKKYDIIMEPSDFTIPMKAFEGLKIPPMNESQQGPKVIYIQDRGPDFVLSAEDSGYNIDSVLIVVNGKMLPKSMNRQIIKPQRRMREYVKAPPSTVEEALKAPLGPADGNLDDGRQFYFDSELKKELQPYFLNRDEYVDKVRVIKDVIGWTVYGKMGYNGVIEITTRPFLSEAPLSSNELKTRRQRCLLDAYQGDNQVFSSMSLFKPDGFIYNSETNPFDPDLFDTPSEERLFGLLTRQHGHIRQETFGLVGNDANGIYVPLIREVEIKLPSSVDLKHAEDVINDIRQAAKQADKSIEQTDSIVRLAFIFGGNVKKGKPHRLGAFQEGAKDNIVKESIFYFTPDKKAASYWWAEVYYNTTSPRQLVMHLLSVDKLYASECPAILKNRRHVEGTVLDENGQPMPDALVDGFLAGEPSDAGGVRTDNKGHFDLWLPYHDTRVRASKFGYLRGFVAPTDTDLTIRMQPK